MLIDSVILMEKLDEIDRIYERMNCVGIPSYPVFKSLIQAMELEAGGKE